MSEYSAKTLREKMKAKARALAAPGTLAKDQKTDSSDWSPAEPLNADIKTGMRPISKRAYKGGGKVSGAAAKARADRKPRKAGGRVETDIGVGMANKNMKEANKSREGVKHVGGFKKGGEVKDAGVKDKKALGAIDPSPKRGAAQHYKKGGRTKKEGGGFLENLGNALSGKGYIDGSTWLPKGGDNVVATDETAAPIPPRRPVMAAAKKAAPAARMSKSSGSPGLIPGADTIRQSGRFLPEDKTPTGFGRMISPADADYSRAAKKGGKIKKAGGGLFPSPEEAIGSEERLKGIKAMPGKSSTSAAPVTPAQLRREESYTDADMKATRSGRRAGGRKGRATGGATLSMAGLKGGKKVSRKAGKTDINIVINASKAPERRPEGAPKLDAGMAPPAPPMDAGAPPPAMPPMGAPGLGGGPMLPPGLPLPGRKAGGRVSKIASSYKDMTAGAGSGEGRLQKVDIAKKHHGAPARKAGGRISKVAKSYKDMTAGAGSGEGRLQKTDIAKAKVGRGG